MVLGSLVSEYVTLQTNDVSLKKKIEIGVEFLMKFIKIENKNIIKKTLKNKLINKYKQHWNMGEKF